jgi:ABC-2 type transport system ATP-binding protein
VSIEVEHLVKRYGETVAVAGVTFAVGRGEIFGYLGRNGSGKTTTVRMLTTLTRPSSGRANVAGADIADVRRCASRSASPCRTPHSTRQ